MGSTERIEARKQLASAVAELSAGNLSFVEGVRRIFSLREQVGAEDFDSDFMIFAAINSESAHLLSDGAKALAAPSWLSKSEAEEDELRQRYSAEVYAASERLLKKFNADDA